MHTFKFHDDGDDIDERFRLAAVEAMLFHLVGGEVVDDGDLIADVVDDAVQGGAVFVHAGADGELRTGEDETGFRLDQ